MKALVYTGPNALEWRDEPEPTLGDHEVLVRVEAVGICGSDMHAYPLDAAAPGRVRPSSCAPPSATPSFCPTASTPPRLRSLSPSPSRTTRCSRERACLDARSPRAAVPSSGGGAIGLGCALVLAWQGAQNIAIGEPNEGRRRTAARAGPFRCYEPKGRDSPADGSVDLVI